MLAQVKRRRVLGLRPALRNAIRLPGLNRWKDGHRSLLINYLRDILKYGPRAKCKLLQPFPPTGLWAVSAHGCPQGEITWGQPPSAVRSSRLDLLLRAGQTSVARCLNRTAGGGRPHVVSCRDTPHHEHTNEKVTHSRKPPAGGARNSGASLRRPAGAALPAVLPAYIFPAAPQSQEAIVPDITFLGCMAISSCHLSPPCRAT